MVSLSTAPDVLLAHFMREAILEARFVTAMLERAPRPRRRLFRSARAGVTRPGNTERLYAHRILNVIHNAPLAMFDSSTGLFWPDGQPVTGPEAALAEIARLLPAERGYTDQDGLVLRWADRALSAGGLTVIDLQRWASPLIDGPRLDDPTRPR